MRKKNMRTSQFSMSTFTSQLIITSPSISSSSPPSTVFGAMQQLRARPSPLLGSLLCISLHLHAREMASRYAKRDQLTERSAKPSKPKKGAERDWADSYRSDALTDRSLEGERAKGCGEGGEGGDSFTMLQKGNLPFASTGGLEHYRMSR